MIICIIFTPHFPVRLSSDRTEVKFGHVPTTIIKHQMRKYLLEEWCLTKSLSKKGKFSMTLKLFWCSVHGDPRSY